MEDYMCKFTKNKNSNKVPESSSKIEDRTNQLIQVNLHYNTENRTSNEIVSKTCETFLLNRNVGEYTLKINEEYSNNSIKCLTSNYKINENTDRLNEIIANHVPHNCNKNNLPNRISLLKMERIANTLTSTEKMFADKATCCRPMLNFYNEHFILKTMERNARLKNLVRKLVLHRQHERREGENVTWNNFINELKNKHAILNNPGHSYVIHDELYENINPELINDLYNTKFSRQQSRPCENLLQDFYGSYKIHQPNLAHDNRTEYNSNSQLSKNYKHTQYGKSSFCYPNSSLGRLIMIDREKRKNQSSGFWSKHLSDKDLYKTINKCFNDKKKIYENSCKRNIIRNIAVQTDVEVAKDFFMKKDKATSNNTKVDKVTLKETQESDKTLKRISLVNIETKLETLIESINHFIEELKLSKKYSRISNQDVENYEINNMYNEKNVDLATRENFTFPSANKIVHNVNKIVNASSSSSLHLCNLNKRKCCQVSTLDDILREIDENKLSLDNTLKSYQNKPCSVKITFEVPTKDCSTEVTKSLSRQDNEIIENIDSINKVPFEQNMTIAVNTDPLSLLALFRMSTDTVKHILSYMPNFNYYSYLSLLPIPRSIRHSESRYVCNICGADFCSSSELSEHIPEHNLGKARDCCVCRHVLKSTRRAPALFRCRYCGQCFTRAYCCELHQKSCAKELGRKHDVPSNLMLLR